MERDLHKSSEIVKNTRSRNPKDPDHKARQQNVLTTNSSLSGEGTNKSQMH